MKPMHKLCVHVTGMVFALLVARASMLSDTLFAQPGASAKGAMLVYFGTYTNEKSKGVYVSRLDLASGKVTPPELAAETPNPSYLAIHPRGDFLYAANEVRSFDGKDAGSVSAFAIDRKTGKLTPLNQASAGARCPA